ncbi:MAG: acyl-CoA mutase large subunit family protein [Bacteroidales bacterium]|jgi:methylmalonyl-CoA mutase
MNKKEKEALLFSEFPPVSTREWEEKIREDLKGADYDKKLVWKTTEGINVKPYYRKEDIEKLEYQHTPPGEFPFISGQKTNNNAWEIRQDIEEPNPDKANKIAIDAIKRGAEAIGFNTREIEYDTEMKDMLDGIDLSKVSVHFTSASSFPVISSLFLQELSGKKIDTLSVKGSLNFDPLSYYLLYGKFYTSQNENFDEAASIIKNLKKEIPLFKAITINGQYFHNAGASIIQELAFSLASANEYLVQLTDRGLKVDDIAPRIQFVFAIGSNYFMEIAKLRAARILWSKIIEQYNPANENSMKMNIHAVTSLWNKSIYDPYVNMLRNTTEAMSAAIGCCDSMSVLPFDITYKNPDEFSERIARNTQLILKSESYLDKVVDPSSGSYYIENLTDSIADVTWKSFLEVNDKGGFIKVVESGFVKEDIENTCQKRDMDIAMRKQIILGTNQYPNLEENMIEKIKPHADLHVLGGLKQYRGARAFEALRLSTEVYEKDGHKRPTVFLFTYGNIAMHKARAIFTINFFGCAGYTIIDNPGFKTIEEGINAVIQSNPDILVYCSSDDEYLELIKAANKQIKISNPDLKLIVAGNPVQIIDQLKQEGVDDFIHVRSNVLEILERYQHIMGII